MFFKKNKKKKKYTRPYFIATAATVIIAQGIIPVGTQAQASTLAEDIENEARQYLGLPYVWGGTSPSGFDCSGLVQYVFKEYGINLPRTAAEQFRVGTPVEKVNLQKGDLVFFQTYKPGASHVGIYLGNGKMIDSNSSGLMISDFNANYWQSRYLGAKRIIPTDATSDTKVTVNSTKQVVEVQVEIPLERNLDVDQLHYTVQDHKDETLKNIAEEFNVTVDELTRWNNLETKDVEMGQSLLVVKPKQSITLFHPTISEVAETIEITTNGAEVEDSSPIQVTSSNPFIQKVVDNALENGVAPDDFIEQIKNNALPTKEFAQSDEVQRLFETKKVTRAEVATALQYVELQSPLYDSSKASSYKALSNDVSDTHWAKDSISWAITEGIITGNESEEFKPDAELTEKQANIIMKRILKEYDITDEEATFISNQLNEDPSWAYKYLEQLVYNLSVQTVEDEAKKAGNESLTLIEVAENMYKELNNEAKSIGADNEKKVNDEVKETDSNTAIRYMASERFGEIVSSYLDMINQVTSTLK